MKRIIAFAFAISLTFGLCASAKTADPQEIYNEQFEQSGVGEIYEALPDEIRKQLERNGISPAGGEPLDIGVGDVFKHIGELAREGFKKPLTVTAEIIGMLILLTLISSLASKDKMSATADIAAVMCAAAVLMLPLYDTLAVVISSIKGTASFMLSLVPVYCAVLAAGGRSLTSASAGSMLLLSTEAVTQFSSFGIAPLMGMYLGVSVSASVSPLSSASGLAELVKKTAGWTLSAALTLFLGILSVQTAISASADTLAMRTTKFLATGIPAVGGAISETVSVVKSSLEMLGDSAAGYGVVAVGAILLPIIIELVLWRIGLTVCIAVGDILANKKISGLLRSVDAVYSFLLGILLYVGLLFIISLAVVMWAEGRV